MGVLRATNNQQGRVNAYSYCVVSLRSASSVGLKENVQNHVFNGAPLWGPNISEAHKHGCIH